VEEEKTGTVYSALPIGIALTPDVMITVSSKPTALLRAFCEERVFGFSTNKRSRFILQILYRNARLFLQYLRQIDKASSHLEAELQKSMRNKELMEMLSLEKSLVYFSTSLKSNEAVMEKLLRLPVITRYPDDTDLLEDVIIENKQAIEMCSIYTNILSSTRDAYASVISNNLNTVMKLLTSLTIILTIPTMISGLWGMNVTVPFSSHPYGFWIVLGIAALLACIATIYMSRKKMF